MKRAQLITMGIAGAGAIAAAFAVNKLNNKPRPVEKMEVRTNTVDVLVAKSDIGLGHIASEASFRWQAWPQDAVPVGAISNRGGGNPMRDLTGSVARAPIMAGEPITKAKLVKAGEGGVLSAILPQGKRAISTKITEDTGVGRMVLPNDHVDIILIRRDRGRNGREELTRETLLRNVRVLAIGQRIEVKDNQKSAEGATATLELTPQQAERLALAKAQGELTMALRSIADMTSDEPAAEDGKRRDSDSVRMTRFGIRRASN